MRSAFIPMALEELEKMVLEKGVVQKVPPIPGSEIKRINRNEEP